MKSRRCLALSLLFSFLLCAGAIAQEKSHPQKAGGLIYFTILPNKNPPPSCEDTSANNASSLCRCCKVTP